MMINTYDNMKAEMRKKMQSFRNPTGKKTRNMCERNKEIKLGNISVIEINAYGLQKSSRPSPPLSTVSNKTAIARTGE